MAVCPDGIPDYDTPDGYPVKLIFMLIIADRKKGSHVPFLAKISKLFCDGRLRAAFLACNDTESCMSLICRIEED